MTFDELCHHYQATPEERAELLDMLVFFRFRDLMRWWDKMKEG